MKFAFTLATLAAVTFVSADVAIDLGTATDFTVVAVGGITNTGASGPIIGNVATTGHNVSGFPADAITGDVEERTPAADQAHSDAEAVWNMLRALEGTQVVSTPDGTIVVTKGMGDASGNGTTNFTGAVFTPGIYNVFSILHVVTNITLNGEGQYIFTSGSHFDLDANASIILANGARARDVFFATGDSTNLLAGARVEGTILSNSAIRLAAGASVHGNIYSQGLMTFTEASVTPVLRPT
ncbi:hypothetical protein C8F04DRAFT_1076638 [Mycena alexandri]|uniref:Ice-binding protein n=1 Tax=Mycena alexandri TaxID=1745969 RepID=A0AAD6XC71_9AGAR|nr:hypothetical protein C8F04DRAFT_1076638 [Mycena alexandri]